MQFKHACITTVCAFTNTHLLTLPKVLRISWNHKQGCVAYAKHGDPSQKAHAQTHTKQPDRAKGLGSSLAGQIGAGCWAA